MGASIPPRKRDLSGLYPYRFTTYSARGSAAGAHARAPDAFTCLIRKSQTAAQSTEFLSAKLNGRTVHVHRGGADCRQQSRRTEGLTPLLRCRPGFMTLVSLSMIALGHLTSILI